MSPTVRVNVIAMLFINSTQLIYCPHVSHGNLFYTVNKYIVKISINNMPCVLICCLTHGKFENIHSKQLFKTKDLELVVASSS